MAGLQASAATRLVREHKKLRKAEKRNYETEMMKGDLREDVRTHLPPFGKSLFLNSSCQRSHRPSQPT